jgi:hypothetical protein
MILDIPCNQFRELEPRKAFISNLHDTERDELTIVPKVTNPTRAFSGKRLKLMTRDSFNADRLSSSWQVSTT